MTLAKESAVVIQIVWGCYFSIAKKKMGKLKGQGECSVASNFGNLIQREHANGAELKKYKFIKSFKNLVKKSFKQDVTIAALLRCSCIECSH